MAGIFWNPTRGQILTARKYPATTERGLNMSIYVTGDCHGEFSKFNSARFPEQAEGDIVIIAGDFGGYWRDTPDERWWLKWLSEKPAQYCFVDGNHENYDRLNVLPVESWNGGLVQRLPHTNILHLMRGQMYNIDGCRIFTFGGTASHDISDGIIPYDENGEWREKEREMLRAGKRMFRIEHLEWWKEEMPSEEEMQLGRDTLEANHWSCDYIITHDCPSGLRPFVAREPEMNPLVEYLQEINDKTDYKRWYFGHHHMDRAFGRQICLYDRIEQIY